MEKLRGMQLQVPHFDREFERFSNQTYPRHGGGPFRSFSEGAARGWEGYKPLLREKALSLLAADTWQVGAIGSGKILAQVIGAIEIGGDDQGRNNLVQWEGRFGPRSAGHYVLKDALKSSRIRLDFERWFWAAFRSEVQPSVLFEGFRALAGNGYPLAAYIFFLLDIERFAPIAPETFDRAFARLGMSISTSGKCSWENYRLFNDGLEVVRALLAMKPGLSATRHIDAHSFLWMMIRMEVEEPDTPKSGPVRFADAKAITIMNMAINAAQASAQSGRPKSGLHKDKQLLHDRDELIGIIGRLVSEQAGLCALTGLPLQWMGDDADPAMIASLDRIDSNGHYEESNLQVVCRFVNQWKSGSEIGEFRRLLSIVRGPQIGAE